MAHRRHAADGEAGLSAHEIGVGLADRLPDQRREAREIHALGAR